MRPAEEMDQADFELRQTIIKVWPYEGKEKIDLLVPPREGQTLKTCSILQAFVFLSFTSTFLEIGKGRLTVGKIYGGLLILENWKATKFGKMALMDGQVSSPNI